MKRKDGGKTRRNLSKTGIALVGVLVVSIAVMVGILYLGMPRPKTKAELRDSELYEDMRSGKSFCFIGDSITRGTVADLTPWYNDLEPDIKGETSQFAVGGWTSEDPLEHLKDIPDSDIYVVALGINDVLVRDYQADEYLANLMTLVEDLRSDCPDAKFYFVTPWPFRDLPEKYGIRRDEFSDALKVWCSDNGFICIDPYPYIAPVIQGEGGYKYLFNEFHPNAEYGVSLFGEGVLKAEHARRVG